MAETVGALILASVGALDVAGATAFAGISVATVVGTAAILGASIGLQYALAAQPSIPKPENGSQPVKQSIPPRIMGYGTNRLAGYYMLFEAAGAPPAAAYNVMAFHHGRISAVRGIYLHDDQITTVVDVSHGGESAVVRADGNGRYEDVGVEIKMGTVPQTASGALTRDVRINSLWTPAHCGHGVAHAIMICNGVSDASNFTNIYPHALPAMSVVADCTPIWDPRDLAQSSTDPATWTVNWNPVIQLMDYLTRADGGMGLDFDVVIAPNLSAWIAEADLCDELVDNASGGQEHRYQSNGWFTFDNAPSDVIGSILSTCDGWLAEAGDGSLAITVGVYREPTNPPLTEQHIFGFALNYGQGNEQLINELDVSYTDPFQKFVTVQTEPWRDENSISATGEVKTQTLDLKWVQTNSQARRLADRAMQRLNPPLTGSFTTSLYGLRYLGKRWIKVQYPYVSGLQDAVIEIVQPAEVDLRGGRISWQFNLINAKMIEAYNPATDEGAPPVIPPSALISQMVREDGTIYAREDGTSLNREQP